MSTTPPAAPQPTPPALDAADRRYIERRREMNRLGQIGLWVALPAVVVAWVALFVWFPLLVNPFELLRRLEARSIEAGTLTTMAIAGQIAWSVVFFLLILILYLVLVWAFQERRLLKLVDKLAGGPPKQG
jgi:hypothetical protein